MRCLIDLHLVPLKLITIGNKIVPKIIIYDTNLFFFKTAVSILLTSKHNSFRVLFDKIASVYFIRKIGYIYILAMEMASPWNQHLCHTLLFPMTKASERLPTPHSRCLCARYNANIEVE